MGTTQHVVHQHDHALSSPVPPQPTNQARMNLLTLISVITPESRPPMLNSPTPRFKKKNPPPSPVPRARGPFRWYTAIADRWTPPVRRRSPSEPCPSALPPPPPCSSLRSLPRTLIFPAQCPSLSFTRTSCIPLLASLLLLASSCRLALSNSNTATYK